MFGKCRIMGAHQLTYELRLPCSARRGTNRPIIDKCARKFYSKFTFKMRRN